MTQKKRRTRTGEQGKKSRKGNLTVREAVVSMLDDRNVSVKSRTSYTNIFGRFASWLELTDPGVRRWKDVDGATLANYVGHLQGRGLTAKTIKHAVENLRMVSRHMARAHGFQDVATDEGLSVRAA